VLELPTSRAIQATARLLFSFLGGQVSFPWSILLCTQLLYSSPNQKYISISEQWYQLPEFIPSNLNSGLHSCISICIHTQHITQIAKLIHYLQLCTLAITLIDKANFVWSMTPMSGPDLGVLRILTGYSATHLGASSM